MKSKMLHPDSKTCCDHVFPGGQECKIVDIGCANTGPASTLDDTPKDCTGHYGWHIVSS